MDGLSPDASIKDDLNLTPFPLLWVRLLPSPLKRSGEIGFDVLLIAVDGLSPDVFTKDDPCLTPLLGVPLLASLLR